MAEVGAGDAIALPDGSVQALVVERHAISRLGFGLLLHRQLWVGRCMLTGDHDEAVELARRTKPDVAIVDVTGPEPFLNFSLTALREAHSGMALVLSTHDRVASARLAQMPGGGAGMLTPDLTAEEVVAVVRRAVVGEQSGALVAFPHDGGGAVGDALSVREHQVLALLSTGATNQEIATAMHISPATVKKHAGALYRKLGVRNRTEAARLRDLVAVSALE